MKVKNLFVRIFSLFLVFAVTLSAAACAKTPDTSGSSGNKPGGTGDPDDHYVTSFVIDKNPTKLQYMEGERFDPTGMEATVTWEDEVVWKSGVDFTLDDLTFKPRTLSIGDTKVLCYFDETNFKEIAVTVGEAKYSLKIKRMPAKTVYLEGDTFDKNGLVITYGLGDDQYEIENYDYSPKGELKTTDKNITVTYNGVSVLVPITVNARNKAFHIEAEDCELYAAPGASLVIKKKTETGGGLDLCEKASGGDFIVDATPGDKMSFTFTTKAAGRGKLSMTASSNATEAGSGNQSSPSIAHDMQVNKVLRLFVNDVEVAIDDSVVLKGVEIPGGSRETWVYWRTVLLAEIDFKEGENKVVILMQEGGYFNSYDKEAYGQYDAFDIVFD